MTHNCNVNFQRGTYPQGIREPRLVICGDQALVDEPCPDNASNGDQDSSRQQHTDTNTLLQWHAQAQDDWDGQYSAEEICHAADDTNP